MNFKELYELIDKTMLTKEISEMNNDIINLKRINTTITLLKSKINKGDIAKFVNMSIEPLNQKYKINFVCEKDEDYDKILNMMINYINDLGNTILENKIKEEIAKRFLNL